MTGCFCALTLEGTCATLLVSRHESKAAALHPTNQLNPPGAPLHQFSSNNSHSSSAVAGILVLRSSETRADGADAAVPVQSLPFLGVCACCGRGKSFPRTQRAHPGHGPPARLQIPSAKWCFQVKFLLCFPSLTTPATLSLFFAIHSSVAQGEIALPSSPPPTAPSPFQQRCHLPSHHRVLLTLSH